MISRRLVLVLAVSGLAHGALAQLRMPKVEVQAAEDVDFSAFKTYGWKPPIRSAERHEVHTTIVWYTERSLEKKGFTKIPDGSDTEPDLFVRYYAKGKSSVQGIPGQHQQLLPGSAETLATTTSFDFSTVRDGTLIIELQQPDDTTVWRAGTDISGIDEKRIDAEVERAVRMLFARYPPKH